MDDTWIKSKEFYTFEQNKKNSTSLEGNMSKAEKLSQVKWVNFTKAYFSRYDSLSSATVHTRLEGQINP